MFHLLAASGPFEENSDKFIYAPLIGSWDVDVTWYGQDGTRRTVARLQAAQRSEPDPPPPWPAHLQPDDEINAWIYESNHGRSVREVLDESHQVFQQILAAIEGLPNEVLLDPQHYLPWLEGNPFSAAGIFAHFHDEHEPDMCVWLAQVEKQ